MTKKYQILSLQIKLGKCLMEQVFCCRVNFMVSISRIFLLSDVSISPKANKLKPNENHVKSNHFSTSNYNSLYHTASNYYPYIGSPKGKSFFGNETKYHKANWLLLKVEVFLPFLSFYFLFAVFHPSCCV